jgi:hypothetical protein
MVDEPDNLVLRLLHDIRQDQVKQTLVIDAQARSMTNRFDVLQETLAYTRGLASHGQVRLDLAERRLEDLEARLARLEAQ